MRGKTKSLFPLNFFFKEQPLELPLSYKSALPFISCISKVCWRSSGLFEAFSLGHEACEHGPTLGTKSTPIFFLFFFICIAPNPFFLHAARKASNMRDSYASRICTRWSLFLFIYLFFPQLMHQTFIFPATLVTISP